MSDDESHSGSEEWDSDDVGSIRDDEDTEDEEEEEGFDDEAAAALLLSAKNAADTGAGGGSRGGSGKARPRGAGKGRTKGEGEGKASGYAPSSYRGVFLSYGKWRATIRANYRNQYLGDYETEEEAAKAFDKAAVQLYENPVLNFLPDGTLNPDRKKSYFAQQLRTTSGTALPEACKHHKQKKPKLKTTDVPAVGAEAQAQAKAKAKAKKAAAEAGAKAAAGVGKPRGGKKADGDGSKECVDYTGSTYRGVFWSYGKWRATIRSHHRNQHLGTFESEEQAARAFDAAAKETYDKPILNFLPDGSLNPNRKQRVAAQRLQTKKGGPPSLDKLKRLTSTTKTSSPSDFRGVYKSGDRWQAGISNNGRSQYLGTFESEEAAARAFDKAAQEMFESPILNFLPDGSVNPDRKRRLAVQKLRLGFAGLLGGGSDQDLGGSGAGAESMGDDADFSGFSGGGGGTEAQGGGKKKKRKRGGASNEEDSYWRPYASSRRRERLATEEQQVQGAEGAGDPDGGGAGNGGGGGGGGGCGNGGGEPVQPEPAKQEEQQVQAPPTPIPVWVPPVPVPEAPKGEDVNMVGVAEEAKEAHVVEVVAATAAAVAMAGPGGEIMESVAV